MSAKDIDKDKVKIDTEINMDQPLAGRILQLLYKNTGTPFGDTELQKLVAWPFEDWRTFEKECERLATEGAIQTRDIDVNDEYTVHLFWAECDD